MMRPPHLSLCTKRRLFFSLLIAGLAAGSPLEAEASPLQLSSSAARGIGVVGGLVSAAGAAVSIYGSIALYFFGDPFYGESQRGLRGCCTEQAIVAPGFLALAGGGLMLGYGVDYARQNTWELVFESRTGLLITGALLGATAALYVTSAALHAASFYAGSERRSGTYGRSESGERMLLGSKITLGASLFLAFPAGISTGVYLSRYLRDRSPPRLSAAGIPRPVGIVFAPAISRETYGLYVAGRF